MSKHITTKSKHLPKEPLKIQARIFVISDSLHHLKKTGKNWKETDKSGQIAKETLQRSFPDIDLVLDVLPDELDLISEAVTTSIEEQISLILTLGGTGISTRDVTIEAISPLIEKELTGFGELFRLKTYETVGTISIMTRTLAGVAQKSCITCLPGSPNATRLGLELILTELAHVLALREK